MNNRMMIKCEPLAEEAELFRSLVSHDEPHQQQQHQDFRMFCAYKLKITEDTATLLEEQGIDMECLRKMRIEDVDVLFEGKPLGPKILFREAFLEWREEIGLPCKSLKALSARKRSSESSDSDNSSPPKQAAAISSASALLWDESLQQQHFQEQRIKQQQQVLEKDSLPNRKPTVSYSSFGWPMNPVTLKDILNSSPHGRSILAAGELGGLSKSQQYQLTAIIISYHMEYNVKITIPQLENYACCIVTLLPHENSLTYYIPRGPNRRTQGGSLYSRFINQKISKKALAIGNSVAAS
ncbi:uncharacterized protein LOC131215939 [Anopheles bellator]|uniref:uncharacterized protein LOC131215939 n=1 Tax=Anopheles bellator TaxID=139047 RepID=UPI002648D122|nr:uncharacterized protein LOC131215939 [Anopheles bellator]